MAQNTHLFRCKYHIFLWRLEVGSVTCVCHLEIGFPGGSVGKDSAWNAGDLGSIPGSGRSPGKGHVNSLQYSCLENSMNRSAWWATVHGVTKTWTNWVTNTTTTYHINSWSLRLLKWTLASKGLEFLCIRVIIESSPLSNPFPSGVNGS